MHRFFVLSDSIQGDTVLLPKKESHHALSVLRVQVGEVVEILDGSGRTLRGIASKISEGQLLVQIDKNTPVGAGNLLPVEIALAVSVIKPEPMDLLIQKACELGVRRIVPLITERCVIKLTKERWDSKIERWQKIVAESCKQCGRTALPEVTPLKKFDSFLAETKNYDKAFIPTLAVPGKNFSVALSGVHAKKILVFIGPEGDFTKKEAEAATSQGVVPVSLGSLVMRTETAAIFTLSVLNYLSGELASN